MPEHPPPVSSDMIDTLDVTSCLVVDDFGIRHGSQYEADHLIATLRTERTTTNSLSKKPAILT
jgi:hypothetical protein